MYQEKVLQCACCFRYFRRGSNNFREDQLHFFNRAHKHRFKPTRGRKELTITEARMRKYNKPGCGNIKLC